MTLHYIKTSQNDDPPFGGRPPYMSRKSQLPSSMQLSACRTFAPRQIMCDPPPSYQLCHRHQVVDVRFLPQRPCPETPPPTYVVLPAASPAIMVLRESSELLALPLCLPLVSRTIKIAEIVPEPAWEPTRSPLPTLLLPPLVVIHLIDPAYKPWTRTGQRFSFTVHRAPPSISVNELAKIVGHSHGANGIAECIEVGDGEWVLGSVVRLGDGRGKRLLADMGWGGERGTSDCPLWLALV